jgi:hypothetical protein
MRPIWWPACVYWPKRLEFTDSLSGSVRCPPCDTVLASVPRINGREGLEAASCIFRQVAKASGHRRFFRLNHFIAWD